MEKIITEGIRLNNSLRLQYDGNDRHVIPLAWGMLKNGREGLLCYKLDELPDGSFTQSIRLYYSDKIADVKVEGLQLPFSRKIDYYLPRHYRQVVSSIPTLNNV